MNKKFFTLILCIILFSAAEISAETEKSGIENILQNKSWQLFRNGYFREGSLSINFHDNGELEATSYHGENMSYLKGSYRIADNGTVHLKYIIFSGYDIEPDGKFEDLDEIVSKWGYTEATAEIVYQNNAPDYSLVLKCDNGLYLKSCDYIVQEGQICRFDDMEVISMGGKRGVTIDNVRIRPVPSLNSQYMEFSSMYFGQFSYVPKDYYLHVFARTAQKEQIGEWNNYWYYVYLEDCDSEMESHWAWLFAEFVELK